MSDEMEEIIDEKQEMEKVAKVVHDVRSNLALLGRAVAEFDSRFTLRALRSISSLRKRLSDWNLCHVIAFTYGLNSTARDHVVVNMFLDGLGLQMAELSATVKRADYLTQSFGFPPLPKSDDRDPVVDVYIAILIQVYLYDNKKYLQGAKFSLEVVTILRNTNQRTLDPLAARVYFYLQLLTEQVDQKPPSRLSPTVELRGKLLGALRTAVLRKDQEIQAAVIVLLLRNYISTADISQADALVAQVEFPQSAPNNQVARYMYYQGRIRAIQLSYTDAHEHLASATRKAPTSPVAVGFYQASMKFLVVVELLMGDIPDRSIFSQPKLERALEPYFQLVKAVRAGEMQGFLKIVQEYSSTFHRDGTYTLVLRLRQNVIRTGIRMLSLSYSRISLRDICIRLGLESEESAEYIVAKAIRDGVIEATIDHEKGYMQTKQAGDVYATREPTEAFHERIKECLMLHDECVKAMRFPMNQHRLELKNAQEARERERELAKEIQDGEIDDDDAAGDFEGL